MKKLLFILAALILIGSINALAERDTNNVSKKIVLPLVKEYQVKIGKASFPHAKHFMDAGYSCGTCHHEKKVEVNGKMQSVPLTTEKVKAMMAEGKNPFQCKSCHGDLSRKQYKKLFHKNCLSCHKTLKKEGKNVPTKCKECHIKPKRRKAVLEGC
ncbi:cytochrome c3 family protein [Thermodesulfatator indicus]